VWTALQASTIASPEGRPRRRLYEVTDALRRVDHALVAGMEERSVIAGDVAAGIRELKEQTDVFGMSGSATLVRRCWPAGCSTSCSC
jgi:hypothetical protein